MLPAPSITPYLYGHNSFIENRNFIHAIYIFQICSFQSVFDLCVYLYNNHDGKQKNYLKEYCGLPYTETSIKSAHSPSNKREPKNNPRI